MLAGALRTYLSRNWDTAVEIVGLARIAGGASRETWRFDALVDGAVRPLILRRDPGGSLIETERALEFSALKTVYGRLPVPEPLILESGGRELERPFFIMARIDGGLVPSPIQPDPYGEHAAAIGAQFFGRLGDLAAIALAGTAIAAVAPRPGPDECWRVALDHWAGVIDADERHPQPVVRAAIRRLRANPPPRAGRVAIVHGDYRSGNFLHDGTGNILALLDWEMAHLGDPLEDLAWAIDPLWGHDDPDRVAGMLPRASAIAVWERHSGLNADPLALAWWSLFAAVKGMAIWTSAAREFVDGGLSDPVLAFSGWYIARRHEEILADALQRFAVAA
jgi:aminoglycoside phosphotransferase (APT) family kinase protein